MILENKRNEILQVISKRGQNPVQGNIYTIMPNWISWYRGNVNDFHRYKRKTVVGSTKKFERLTLNMAKKICEDWTTLLFNEKVQITLEDDSINELVHRELKNNNFEVEYNNLLEKTFAMGTGAMVQFINNDEIMIDYITGDMLIVSSYRNNEINGIVTINNFQEDDDIITHLTFHTFEKDMYIVEHEVYVSSDAAQLGKTSPVTKVFPQEDLVAMLEDDNITMEVDESGVPYKIIVEYETTTPHFQVLKPNVVNNFDLDNPMGISIYANSIDNLMSIDKIYDAYTNEYDLAKHRIIIDTPTVTKEMQRVTQDGVIRASVFDTDDTVFLGANFGNQEKSIEFYNADIRTDAYVKGLNFQLQLLGFKNGLGTDYYAFDARGVYQNEKAIVSENSDLWASKKKNEMTMLIDPITKLIKSILFLLREKGEIQGDIDMLDITVKPDDSIIIDDEAQYQKDLDLVDRGMMPKWKILVKWFGLTEEEAKEQIEEADNEGIAEKEFDNPVPQPTMGEMEEEFIERFMSNPKMIEEYPDEAQRRAIAQSTWESNES